MRQLFRRWIPYFVASIVLVALATFVRWSLTAVLGGSIPPGWAAQAILAISSFTLTCIVAFFLLWGVSFLSLPAQRAKESSETRYGAYKRPSARDGNLDPGWLSQEPQTRKNLDALRRGQF